MILFILDGNAVILRKKKYATHALKPNLKERMGGGGGGLEERKKSNLIYPDFFKIFSPRPVPTSLLFNLWWNFITLKAFSPPSFERIDGPNVLLVTSRSVCLDWWRCSSVPVINALYDAHAHTRSPQMKVPLSLPLLWIRKDIHIQIQTSTWLFLSPRCSDTTSLAASLSGFFLCLSLKRLICNSLRLIWPSHSLQLLRWWLPVSLTVSPAVPVSLQLCSHPTAVLSVYSLSDCLSLSVSALTVSVLACTLYLLLLLVTCCTLILNKAYRTVGLSVCWSPSIYLSLSKHMSIDPSIHPPVCLPSASYPSIYLSPSIHPFTCLSVCLPSVIQLCIHFLSLSPSIHLSIHPSIYLSFSIHSSILSVCLPAIFHPFIHPYISCRHPSVHQSTSTVFIHEFILSPAYPLACQASIHPSIHPFTCLHPFTHPFIHSFIHSVHLSSCYLSIHPSCLCPSVHPFTCLSTCMSPLIHPSIHPSCRLSMHAPLLYSLLTVSDAYIMYPSVYDYRWISVYPMNVFIKITKAMAKPCWMKKWNIYHFISLVSVGPTPTWH